MVEEVKVRALPEPILQVEAAPPVRVRALAPVAATVPAPAKVKVVAEVVMVSSEATPVNAPAVETFSPPLDVNANVPVELPTATLPVPVVVAILVAVFK